MVTSRSSFYVQEVLYSGFAGRLYGCSRLITSGTSNLAKTGYVKHPTMALLMRQNIPMVAIAESKLLSVTPNARDDNLPPLVRFALEEIQELPSVVNA